MMIYCFDFDRTPIEDTEMENWGRYIVSMSSRISRFYAYLICDKDELVRKQESKYIR